MFFGLIRSSVASETSDVLVDATDYATAKTAYFYAPRAEVSELIDIATSNETRLPGVDIS